MSRPYLGILASEACRQSLGGKRWWHLTSFVRAYAEVLADYDLIVTSNTAEMLRDLTATPDPTRPPWPELTIKDAGPSFEGVVRLAAKVARREINRVLWFQDPADMRVDRAENYALLRNCNLAGAHLLVNAAAHLWALHSCKPGRHTPAPGYIRTPVDHGRLKETVIFIAHDQEKPRMSRFVLHFRDAIRPFPRLLATSGTLGHIEEFLKDHVPPHERLPIEAVGATASSAHGPSGGDVVVAEEIYDWYGAGGIAEKGRHVLHHILFFADNRRSHPHEADIRVLLKTCVNPQHRVNLILNSRMAEEWGKRYLPPYTVGMLSRGV